MEETSYRCWPEHNGSAENRSVDVLEHILSHDDCDVDPVDNWGNTPLHIAIEKNKEEPEARNYIVENLLDAGADTRYELPFVFFYGILRSRQLQLYGLTADRCPF